MHAIAPYLFRCFNRHTEGRLEERYSTLDNIGTHDLFYMLVNFIQENCNGYKVKEDSKQVYQFSEIYIDEENRAIYGWFNVGSYGIKSDIINVATGEIDFEKATNNAEIIKHYVHYFIPRGFNEGMAFMHSYRGDGIKTLFYHLFAEYFRAQTDLVIQMNPLAYDKAVNAWLDATAKEIKLTKFVGLPDIADQARLLGHGEQELVIKPPRRSGMGKLKDYLDPDSQHRRAIEIMGGFGEQVKTVVELNGKKRTFNIGNNRNSALCEIELEAEIIGEDGNPELNKTKKWVTEIINEYSIQMYPGLNVRVA